MSTTRGRGRGRSCPLRLRSASRSPGDGHGSRPPRSRSRSSSWQDCSARPVGPCWTRYARWSASRKSAPALFSLPAPGRLLVSADSGVWVVDQDGSRRLLGDYREGVVVAVRPLRRCRARERARRARAGRHGALVARAAGRAPPALGRHQDRHADRVLLARATCASWAATARATACSMQTPRQGAGVAAGQRPRLRSDATARRGRGHRHRRRVQPAPRRLLEPPAATVSPDGRWTVVGWADADQLVFTRVGRPRQIQAVSNVSAQFRSRSFPRIEGWCCVP